MIRFVTLLIGVFGVSLASAQTPPSWSGFYVDRYRLGDVYEKLVDNTGDGFTPLYGTRNVREVLSGVLYRGGANNAYDKHGKRPNQNPLPVEGLVDLCQEGFSTAVYLYSTNFSTAPHEETCASARGGVGHVDYLQRTGLDVSQAHEVLQLIFRAIHGETNGPVYVHCWNGWHSSGYVSAVSLRQFCGFTPDEAVNYWNANTDGNNGPSFEPIRAKIRAFNPDPSLEIAKPLQLKICPDASEYDVD